VGEVNIAPGAPEYSADVEGAARYSYSSDVYPVRCTMAAYTQNLTYFVIILHLHERYSTGPRDVPLRGSRRCNLNGRTLGMKRPNWNHNIKEDHRNVACDDVERIQ
jgi:hypothetical protein